MAIIEKKLQIFIYINFFVCSFCHKLNYMSYSTFKVFLYLGEISHHVKKSVLLFNLSVDYSNYMLIINLINFSTDSLIHYCTRYNCSTKC